MLTAHQEPTAEACIQLLMATAVVGINGLIDEATRFQAVRPPDAMQAMLDRLLVREPGRYAERFPPDYYEHLHRLHGWPGWDATNPARGPRCQAYYTNEIVYRRLAPGLLAEIQARNPVGPNGERPNYHHQYLSPPALNGLRRFFDGILPMMRAAADYPGFERNPNRAFRVEGCGLQLDFFDLPGCNPEAN